MWQIQPIVTQHTQLSLKCSYSYAVRSLTFVKNVSEGFNLEPRLVLNCNDDHPSIFYTAYTTEWTVGVSAFGRHSAHRAVHPFDPFDR